MNIIFLLFCTPLCCCIYANFPNVRILKAFYSIRFDSLRVSEWKSSRSFLSFHKQDSSAVWNEFAPETKPQRWKKELLSRWLNLQPSSLPRAQFWTLAHPSSTLQWRFFFFLSFQCRLPYPSSFISRSTFWPLAAVMNSDPQDFMCSAWKATCTTKAPEPGLGLSLGRWGGGSGGRWVYRGTGRTSSFFSSQPTTWQKVPETVQRYQPPTSSPSPSPPPRPPPLPNASPEGLADLGLQFLLERLTFTTPVAGFSKHFRGKLIFQRSPEALWALTEHWWDRPGRREKKKNNPGAFLMFNTIQAHWQIKIKN